MKFTVSRPALPVAVLNDLTTAMFSHSEESGKIRAGIKWMTSTDHDHAECYQFDTLEELQNCARAFQAQPDMLKLSIVTHTGQYKNMRTLYTWEAAKQGHTPAIQADTPAITAPPRSAAAFIAECNRRKAQGNPPPAPDDSFWKK